MIRCGCPSQPTPITTKCDHCLWSPRQSKGHHPSSIVYYVNGQTRNTDDQSLDVEQQQQQQRLEGGGGGGGEVVDIWSNEISQVDFALWFSSRYQSLQQLTYQRALGNCLKLWRGEGLPKTYLTPRRKIFCRGVPINNLQSIDFKSLYESAENICVLYGGEAACGVGGIRWCIKAYVEYKQQRYPTLLRRRKDCMYAFLAAVQRPESHAFVLRDVLGTGLDRTIFAFLMG